MPRRYGTKGDIHITPLPESADDKGKPRKWEVSFSIKLPSGEPHRERRRLVNMSNAQAYKWAEKRRNELLDPSPKATSTTFPELVKLYRQRHLPTLAPAYQDKITATLDRRLLPAFGKLKLSQIDRGRIDDYLATLREDDLQPKAQRDHLALLHKILSLAVEWGLLAALPSFPKVKVPASPIPRFLSPAEHDKLLASARNHEEYTLLLFATDSGTRSAEQVALQWRDVRPLQLVLEHGLNRGTIASGLKETKSRKPRVVPLSERCEQALAKLKAEREARGIPCADNDFVFGSYIPTVKALYKRVIRACKRAGIEATSRHGLRHTYASWLISSGKVSLAELQQLGGWSSYAVVQRYAHLIPGSGDNVRGVLDALSKATTSPSGLTTE